MKKLRLKRLVSFLLCLLMVFSFVAPVYANVGIEVQREIYEGAVYEVVITYDEYGNKVVTTSSSDGYVATVVNDGVYLHLTELNIITGEVWEHSIRLEPYEPVFTPEPFNITASNSTRHWGYSWRFNSPVPPIPTLGEGWALFAGQFGTAVGHDGNRPAARNAAIGFQREVDTMASTQNRVYIVLGAGVAGIVKQLFNPTAAVNWQRTAVISIAIGAGACLRAAGYVYDALRARSRAQVQFTIFRNNAILA